MDGKKERKKEIRGEIMNIAIFVVSIVWAYIYNSHFGWNWSSKTSEEIICDGIFAILICLSIKG